MKAITLTQPWATLMATRAKRCETRSWAPPASLIGQTVAIHAAKGLGGFKLEPDEKAGVRELEHRFAELLATPGPIRAALIDAFKLPKDAGVRRIADCLPRGMIVAAGILYDVLPSDVAYERLDELRPSELDYGNYAPGRFVWGFHSLAPVGPIEARGGQGLWDVPADIADALAELPQGPR